MCIKNDSAELHFPVCDLGSTKRAKTSVRRADVCAGACDINVKAISGRRTIAIAKIADDAPGASMSLFGLTLTASKSLLEAQEGLPSKPRALLTQSGHRLLRCTCPLYSLIGGLEQFRR